MTEFIRSLLFATAHWCGGSLGAAIFVVSFVVRLAMMPLALHMARAGRKQAVILKSITGRLDAIKVQHASDPAALWNATRAVHREVGYQPFSVVGLVGILAQWPLMAALFGAVRKGLGAKVRFLWVADLARPDQWLVTIATLMAAGATAAMVPAGSSRAMTQSMVALTSIMTFGFLWFASSAIAVSYGAGSVVGMLQGWLVRREVVREKAVA